MRYYNILHNYIMNLIKNIIENNKTEKESRPWGSYYTLIKEDNILVKVIVVDKKSRLSLQSHESRSEIWLVVNGSGKAYFAGSEKEISIGDIITIGIKEKHRIINDTDSELYILEIQHGSCIDENDIIRYEDDYKRV